MSLHVLSIFRLHQSLGVFWRLTSWFRHFRD